MTAAALRNQPDIVDVAETVAPADSHHLGWLESEAIHILREVAGQCRNPAITCGTSRRRLASPRRRR